MIIKLRSIRLDGFGSRLPIAQRRRIVFLLAFTLSPMSTREEIAAPRWCRYVQIDHLNAATRVAQGIRRPRVQSPNLKNGLLSQCSSELPRHRPRARSSIACGMPIAANAENLNQDPCRCRALLYKKPNSPAEDVTARAERRGQVCLLGA